MQQPLIGHYKNAAIEQYTQLHALNFGDELKLNIENMISILKQSSTSY